MNKTGKFLKPGTIRKGFPKWKIEQEKLNRQVENFRLSKINEGLARSKELEDESQKMINTEGMEDIESYFLNL